MPITTRPCPYVGLTDDPETHLLFPSVRNVCHRARPQAAVRPDYQLAHCLCDGHLDCPIFLGNKAAQPLPVEMQAYPPIWYRYRVWIMIGVFLLVAVILSILFWRPEFWASSISPTQTSQGLPSGNGSPAPADTPRVEPEPVGSPSAVASPLVVISPSTTLPKPPTPISPTPAPVILPDTETPVVASPTSCEPPTGWVEYVVQAGDTLFQIGASFGVTVEELQDANCLGTSTVIYVGDVLYVPNVPTRTAVPPATPTEASLLSSETPTPESVVQTETP
jgi:LysM repeat protein